jgi:hypothetical protein
MVGVYEIVAGAGILGWWAREYGLTGGRKAEQTDRFHVASELMTAALLFGGGTASVLRIELAYGLSLVGLGMLVYATANSAGAVARHHKAVGLAMGAEAVVSAALVAIILAS